MQSNLAKIFRIQRFLEDIKYPDSQRIAREITIFLGKKKKISEEEVFQKLHKHEPWEYVKGDTFFCNNIFKITKDVLIPRIETEQLVEECKNIIEEENIKNIIDTGTGSGCIAISLAYLLNSKKNYSFYATDISKEALDIAKKNEKNILRKKTIKWIKGNLLEKVPVIQQDSILIANLPYIPTKQYENLDKSVLDYEPRLALDGGTTGLDLYRELFEQVKKRKDNIKVIYIETEESIYKETKELILKYFKKASIKEIKDCFSRNRFLEIRP